MLVTLGIVFDGMLLGLFVFLISYNFFYDIKVANCADISVSFSEYNGCSYDEIIRHIRRELIKNTSVI